MKRSSPNVLTVGDVIPREVYERALRAEGVFLAPHMPGDLWRVVCVHPRVSAVAS